MKKILAFLIIFLLSFNAKAQTQTYDNCLNNARSDDETALCMKAETARLIKEIQDVYVNMAKNPLIQKFNKGSSLSQGNLKDMYGSWLAYRNRYCALFVAASVNGIGSESYNRERCILNLTNDHYTLVKNTIINAASGSEEGNQD